MATKANAAHRWRMVIGGWIAILAIVAVLTYSLSNAQAEPRAVLISGTPASSVAVTLAEAEATVPPVAVSLADVQGNRSGGADDDRPFISPTIAPLLVGAMLFIVFIATGQRRPR